ncbi:sugar phosphorylase [Erwinia tasmaniensis]|uniref:Sucrose phosphorylase n=1 Tax=Erwinia tasmaniensis (strain DSM 17950 / CFBP 7177 / CIP 109463 / NCPPB 4357 / Et1/99) TaxID=465817 RepID=B2VJV7_ERWT9|nr:sugar phosphorylase [Erwinia tasmaniensis]CAO98271.1 Sucrose phosphorylase [Erwinia tasmaniensis Et1/99]
MNIINRLIGEIYGSTFPSGHLQRLHALIAAARTGIHPPRKAHWDEKDVVLITYADQVREDNTPTLTTFSCFYRQYLQASFNLVHLLPFFPSSSDDGFAVIDYHQVNPPYGGWQEIADLHQHTRLMFDFVCNHMSAHSSWFSHYLAQDVGWDDFFISQPPTADLSAVTRPRTSPLLTPFVLADGKTRFIWTTFSADQVDLNYANPDVLLNMVRVLLDYLQRGADYLRLDAVGYMWKTPGTSCIHLEKTHLLVKLFRAIIDKVAAGAVLLTETNVPHRDNIRYFGNGRDEAQMVYQFPLPPLVLHAIHRGSSRALRHWASSLDGGGGSTTFFNFLASHDGIGLNPLRGILPEGEIIALAQDLAQEGAQISWKTDTDGTSSPYEINVTYLDALNKQQDSDDTRLQRFLLAHGLLLAFPGVPAVYVQSILGSRNDIEGMKVTGQNRAINRQKYALCDIRRALATTGSLRQRIYTALSQLIQVRKGQPAFHPDNPMRLVDSDDTLLVMQRQAKDPQDTLWCVFNVSASTVSYRLPEPRDYHDAIGGEKIDGKQDMALGAWQFRWLRA